MSQWSDYFHENMQYPDVILQAYLLCQESILASTAEQEALSAEAIAGAWKAEVPKPPIVIGESKFIYVMEMFNEQDGLSFCLYQKVKKEGEEESSDAPNLLFVVKMDSLLWMGRFSNKHREAVISYVKEIASTIFDYLVQENE
ncbi:hypothetical protein NEHOM01_0354 [Nematocida homosporus]|uniref:uncharacterized protein n=1 Tax=Nematocida homosporus TaxID=1912981 RepID=UPI00221EDE02|nr:uncharacterized protein NEHOM01_0354 [Nematocida homosporus]KAI5184752.1 hypothetical protein NEHOM01_0354 [Nematocida homosporus]